MNRFTDLALDKNALDFQDLFQEVLSQKVSDALDAKKVEIAVTMFEDPAIAEEKIEMTRGGRATGNAIADIVAKNNARLAKKKADRAKHLRKKEKYDGGVKEEVELDESRGAEKLGDMLDSDADHETKLKRIAIAPTAHLKYLHKYNMGQSGGGDHPMVKHISAELKNRKMKNEEVELDEDALKAREQWMKARGVSTGNPKADRARKVKRLMKSFPMKKEEVELDEGMIDHIAKIHVHGSNVTLHMDNGKKSTQRHPSPEAALKDGRAYHKATGREAKLVIAK